MKHLLNGVAIAAALAIAAPAWAQAPMTPSSGAPSAGAPSAAAPTASKQRHKRTGARHVARRGGGKRGAPGDVMTEQLNREELARIQGGAPAGMAPPPSPQALQGPRVSGH